MSVTLRPYRGGGWEVDITVTVLSTLLKKAVEWGELERLPCAIKSLPNPKKTMGFHDPWRHSGHAGGGGVKR